jgi:hypothetical protein
MVILSSSWGGLPTVVFFFQEGAMIGPSQTFLEHWALPQHRSLNMLTSPKIEACFCLSISWVDKHHFHSHLPFSIPIC